MAMVIPKLVTIQIRTGFYTMETYTAETYTAGHGFPYVIARSPEQLAEIIKRLTEAGRINNPGAKYVQYYIGIAYEE